MSDSKNAASRIGNLLQERLNAAGHDVEELYVIPRLDGLVINWTRVDGSFMQTKLQRPTWYAEFRENEGQFVDQLTSGLPRLLSDSHWNEKGQLDLQYLFIRVLQDLERISRSQDDYDNLRVAALLRVLLIDERPLIHRVNRLHKLPLRFLVGRVLLDDVVDPKTLPPSSAPRLIKVQDGRLFHAAGDAFDPQTSKGAAQELTWDAFLKALVLKIEDHFVSVHEFVSHMAYVEGVVHVGEPTSKRPADEALQKWRRLLSFPGRGPLLQTLAAIGRVVFASQVPLLYECDRALAEGRQLFGGEPDAGTAPAPDSESA